MPSPAREELRAALQQMASALRTRLREDDVPKAAAYSVTRRAFVKALADAFLTYVSSARGGSAKRDAGRSLIESISAAFYRGFRDGGGEETEKDDEAWLTKAQGEQLAYLDSAFESLKVQRDNETATEPGLRARAEVWGATLDGIYAEGKARADGKPMLTFKRRPGAKASKDPCAECARYNGKRHSAAWWLKRGLMERNGNPNYGCGRWETCTHSFFTDDGKLYAR